MLRMIQNKCKKIFRSRQGFTLVELIVVLVILAILGAVTVPVMTGWIDKAKQKQAEVYARTIYLAAQTVVTESYAQLDSETFEMEFGNGLTVTNENTDMDTAEGRITSLAGISGSYVAEITISGAAVTGLVFTSEHDETVVFGDVSGDMQMVSE